MRAAALILAVVLAACGSSGPCPSSPPKNGAACTRTSGLAACEWGGDEHTDCTTWAACETPVDQNTSSWYVSTPDPTCGTLAASCPASYGAMEGTTCSTSQPSCDYAEGVCACIPCTSGSGMSAYWHCRAWSDVPAGCPVPRARLGTPCDSEGLTCDYTQCCAGPAIGYRMRCMDGYWMSYVDTGCACAWAACP